MLASASEIAEMSLTHELSWHIWWLEGINSGQLIFFRPFWWHFLLPRYILQLTAATVPQPLCAPAALDPPIYPFSIHPNPSSGTSTVRGEGVDKPGKNTITSLSQLLTVTWKCEEVWGSKGPITELLKEHWCILTLCAVALILISNAWIKHLIAH